MSGQASAFVVTSPARNFSYAIETARQADRINADAGMPMGFNFRSGSDPSLTVRGMQTGSSAVVRMASQTGFSTKPKIWADAMAVSFITSGSVRRADLPSEFVFRPNIALTIMFDALRMFEASAGFASLTVTVSRASLTAAHLALEGHEGSTALPRFVPVVDATGQPLQALKATMATLFERLSCGVEDADLVYPLLDEVMAYRLLTAWPRQDQAPVWRPSSPGRRPLRLARDFIDGHLSEKLLLSDVAAAAGVGVRRLQTIIKTETGRTPVQLILERRLERVRADLGTASDSGLSVGEIAARWGFTHMGDFGRRYRARFGEPPSLTRRRSAPSRA